MEPFDVWPQMKSPKWGNEHVTRSVLLLQTLQHNTGLFSAAPCISTGYSRSWIRDNIYATLGLAAAGEVRSVVKAYKALFDVLRKHEYKIDWAIKEKPKHRFQYIHARYDPASLSEISEEWGNKQNDAIGAFMFMIGKFEKEGLNVIRDENDKRILQKLVYYLNSVEYWHDEDNGMWEENEEIHASSVGACVAGLRAVSDIVYVPPKLIQKGMNTLNEMLPRESASKETDMALLSMIYPYNIVSGKVKEQILEQIETKLLRNRGLIRYEGDQYYNENGEAEWCMGLPWLAKIYKDMGMMSRYRYFLEKTYEAMTDLGELPELYFSNSDKCNANTPLAWSQSMFLVAVL
jgi:GH15 family glucan-1,4-alpha-glucosidase